MSGDSPTLKRLAGLMYGKEEPPDDRWHFPPAGADWTDHAFGPDCVAHMASAALGEAPFGGVVAHKAPLHRGPDWAPSDDLPF